MRLGKALASCLEHPAVGFAARLALVSAFLLSGILKALDFPAAVGEVRALAGFEPAALFAVLVIAAQIGGSVLVLLGGMSAVIGAALLAGFTALATLLGHPFWTKAGVEQVRDLTTFFEHFGLIGGFLLAAILVSSRRAPE
ncbi:DoxX family protein [Desertibaculum subflavum]|uniref:DoxX family protein n=1 Tax=Desertibaculum subflavum TaxID=2268458 RepID=UPI000E66B4C3